MLDKSRGVLYPEHLPRFHRLPASPGTDGLLAHVWVSEWDVPDGEVSPQTTIAFPTANLVVEDTHVGFFGATTRATTRELRGRGWAVGLLLQPAAVPALVDDPAARVDTYDPYPAEELHAAVSACMADQADDRLDRARDAASAWLLARAGEPTEQGRQANTVIARLRDDPGLITLADAASALHLSERTIQRICLAHVGLSPAAIIRRRRLHEAAAHLRATPRTSLAEVAASAGYSDHAHLTRDFTAVLGVTPSQYRDATA